MIGWLTFISYETKISLSCLYAKRRTDLPIYFSIARTTSPMSIFQFVRYADSGIVSTKGACDDQMSTCEQPGSRLTVMSYIHRSVAKLVNRSSLSGLSRRRRNLTNGSYERAVSPQYH